MAKGEKGDIAPPAAGQDTSTAGVNSMFQKQLSDCDEVPGDLKTEEDISKFVKKYNDVGLDKIAVFDKTVNDKLVKVWCTDERNAIQRSIDQMKTWGIDFKNRAIDASGSAAYYQSLRQVLDTIAIDAAEWIGSAGTGKKPMWETQSWDAYLWNAADNAAGKFIEEIGKNNFFKFNLCQPSFGVGVSIGLGLVASAKPGDLECTFSKMRENWEEELSSKNFLQRFQTSFEPTSSDLGIALSLHTGMLEATKKESEAKTKDREEGKGWLDLRGIDGMRKTFPGYAESKQKSAEKSFTDNLAAYTGDAFVDASNIFLNQLGITMFDRLMRKIADNNSETTSPYQGNYGGLTDYMAGGAGGGIKSTDAMFTEFLEARFNVRGDYKILSELTMCSNPEKAGPTSCVITDRFSQAVISKISVGEAIKQKYLDGGAIFGFAANGLEPRYNEAYPYRSMIILRKFRIIPVGWEVAAEYIKNNIDKIGGSKNLNDLVACFSASDSYTGYFAPWCQGLVDPNWTLKAPLNYCKREGAGPEVLFEKIMGEGAGSEFMINRNDKYCADEQSCIKENEDDNTCQIYGYCTEEKRKWSFDAKGCVPNNNTCQTFVTADKQTFSYLENTVD
ncbi:MAG: hypothetical protein K9K75_04560 [Deltaproteobacteria bacterium]|nr:hypothetical protein [Deltaproteobacteria bacterium]